MADTLRRARRLLVGAPYRTEALGTTALSRRLGLPVIGSDAISSVVYAPEQILMALAVAGTAGMALQGWVGLAVGALVVLITAAQAQSLRAYPTGGGDYEVTSVNLGQTAGRVAGSALLLDYVLTVAVSVSAVSSVAGSAIPFLAHHPVASALLVILVLAATNVRGVRFSGLLTAIPAYGFMLAMAILIGTGLMAVLRGSDVTAESAHLSTHLAPSSADDASLGLLIIVALRAFAAGSVTLTGLEAFPNSVTSFKRLRVRNAERALWLSGGITLVLLLGLAFLAQATGVRPREDGRQRALISQITDAVFSGSPVALWFVTITTLFILFSAANTAYFGFPTLAWVLSRDGNLLRHFGLRGKRLTFTTGIVTLSIAAALAVIVSGARVANLIDTYVVGVFVAFLLGQLGMVRHWTRHLDARVATSPRRIQHRNRILAGAATVATVLVLVGLVLWREWTGGFIGGLIIAVVTLLMTGVHRHYRQVSDRLAAARWRGVRPSRTHAVVIVSGLHLPTRRALAFAQAARPDTLVAITANLDDGATRSLISAWQRSEMVVPLKVIEAPYRDAVEPVLRYLRRVRGDDPRSVVNVYCPEFIPEHWWERLLHTHQGRQLRRRLLREPGVLFTGVPFRLGAATVDPESSSPTNDDDAAETIVSTPEQLLRDSQEEARRRDDAQAVRAHETHERHHDDRRTTPDGRRKA